MQLNSRVAWGLAWAGLALVIAVPSVDAITSQFSRDASTLVVDDAAGMAAPRARKTALVAPIPAPRPASRNAVAAAKPAATAPVAVASNSADPVDRFVSAGKQMPSYITGDVVDPAPSKPTPVPAPAQVAATPDKPVTWGESKWGVSGGKDPLTSQPQTVTSVASLSPQPELVAPVPMPASMRPKTQVAARPAVTPGIDPQTVASFNGGSDRVTARDLQDWESGPLSEFLAKRQQTKRFPQQQAQRAQQYDPQADGDFVEYDNSPQYLGPVDNGSFFVWN